MVAMCQQSMNSLWRIQSRPLSQLHAGYENALADGITLFHDIQKRRLTFSCFIREYMHNYTKLVRQMRISDFVFVIVTKPKRWNTEQVMGNIRSGNHIPFRAHISWRIRQCNRRHQAIDAWTKVIFRSVAEFRVWRDGVGSVRISSQPTMFHVTVSEHDTAVRRQTIKWHHSHCRHGLTVALKHQLKQTNKANAYWYIW